MYLSDYHTHCSLSFDSKTPVEDMVRAAIAQGLRELCLTDHVDLYPSGGTEQEARGQLADYLALELETARLGRFSVLGHLTLPLRYMNEHHGMHMSFDGFEDEVAQILRAVVEGGRGIECNVNRGSTPLPDAKWLKLYRSLGGEIVTVGTDAHTPEYVGVRVRETQELLQGCGFRYVCTFEKRKPVFHKI